MGSRVNEGVTSSLAQTMILEWLGPIETGLKHKDFVSVHNHNIFEGWANAAINMIKKVTEAWQLICRRRARVTPKRRRRVVLTIPISRPLMKALEVLNN